MNVALDPVDTYLMLNSTDQYAYTRLALDIEYQAWVRDLRANRKNHPNQLDAGDE